MVKIMNQHLSEGGSAMPQEWKKIDELFHAVLKLEPSERTAFLDKACGNDESLRKEIDSLIASDEEADGFLSSPAEASPNNAVMRLSRLVGQVIDEKYRIDKQLGQGGMGAVFQATGRRSLLNPKI